MTDSVQRELARGLVGHPTADPVTEAVAKRIVQIARLYERSMHEVTARHGVSLGDCEVIWHLAHTDGSQHTPGLLAKAFHVTAGTMTSRLDRLERSGYTDRSIDPGNRASIKVRLTDAGQALHHATADDMIALRRDLITGTLATDDLAALNTLLQHVLTSIERRYPRSRQEGPAAMGAQPDHEQKTAPTASAAAAAAKDQT
jgi:DNA-binding MarR family transcriptional regulator